MQYPDTHFVIVLSRFGSEISRLPKYILVYLSQDHYTALPGLSALNLRMAYP
jgi:hypothetical protein